MPVADRIKTRYKNINFFENLANSNLPPDSFKILMDEYPSLHIEYDTLCIRLTALISSCKNTEDTTEKNRYLPIIAATLSEAKELNQLLFKIYTHTGVHEDEKLKLHKHAAKFRKFKSANTPKSPAPQDETKKSNPFIIHSTFWQNILAKITLQNFLLWLQHCRAFISQNNINRLFVARMRRYLLNIRAMADIFSTNASLYTKIINNLDAYFFGPVLNYLSWLFLLPRLLINIFFTAWHTIKHDNLPDNEKTITWHQRFMLQMRERWPQLANDLIWVPGGILTCFFLIGALNPVGLILSSAMFGWDVLVAIIQATKKLTMIKSLINEHKVLFQKHQSQETENYIKELEKLYTHECKQQMLNIASSITVLILSMLVVPLFTLPVLVPIVASSVLVFLTIVIFHLNQSIMNEKPKPKLDILDDVRYSGLSPEEEQQPPPPPHSAPSPLSNRDLNAEQQSQTLPTPNKSRSSVFY